MPIPSNTKYNVVKSQADESDIPFARVSAAPTALPVSYSMVAKMPPVYDQGELGSCTGNAIAGAYEYDLMKEKVSVFVPSRLFIYYNERLLENDVGQDAGAQIKDGIKVISQYGVCSETIWPYNIAEFAVKPPAGAYAAAKLHTALNFYSVPVSLLVIKQALAQDFPIIAGIVLYESFESDAVAANGIVPMPKPHEQCLGGHAILFVGYDDAKQHIIVRNSWGADWGDKGYFYLPYSYINSNLVSDCWVVKTVK